MKLLALLLLLAAQDSASLTAVTDSVFSPWNSTHSPGCAVGIARNGQVLLTRGYGMADLETGTPITPATIFESGSVAKQFTATAVVLLARDGKLRLDDPVRKYLPQLPEYDRPITIRHLLTHTSGLREWSSLVAWSGWPRGSRAHTQADLLDVVYRQRALNYPVGDFYSYTNSGFAVAMSLVEKVSGQSFQQFTHDRIFAPLGMTHTQWREDFTRLVPGRAQAYTRDNGEWHLEMPFENVIGPGGLLTTVSDWLAWNESLASGGLVPGLADTLTRRMRLTSGREIQYALGLFVQSYRGVREISHSGSTAGYSTYLARFPDRANLSIAVLCNSTTGAAGTYVHRLADRLITDFPVAPSLDTTRVDDAALSRVFGTYRNTRTHAPLRVTRETTARLRALDGGWFWSPNGTRWRFDIRPDGAPGRLLVAHPDGDTVVHVFVEAGEWKPSATQLREYTGDYRSEELGTTFHVAVDGDSLALVVRPGMSRTLSPVYRDAFQTRATTVWFTRDGRGRVTAMHLGESRLWDLSAERQAREQAHR